MSFNITVKSANGISLVPIESNAFESRTIYVEDEINEECASKFIKQIIELNRRNINEPIKVLITSGGGSIIHGLAMYDAMLSSKAEIETYCIGTAYSMAAVIFAAGTRRYILEHSKVMLHEPLVSQGAGGNASSVKSMSDTLQETKNQLNAILCKHTKRTKKQMDKATAYDHYFTAKEAIEFGLADEIVGIDRIL